MAQANHADFFGEGTYEDDSVDTPLPRATTPDGLYYLDDGSPTPELLARKRASSSFATQQDRDYAQQTEHFFTPAQSNDPSQYQYDAQKGQYYSAGRDGRRTYITNDPLAERTAQDTPIYTANFGAGGATAGNPLAGAALGGAVGAKFGGPAGAVVGAGIGAATNLPQAGGRPIYLTEGDGSVGGRQGTAVEADAANARYAATGDSTLPNGYGPGQAQGDVAAGYTGGGGAPAPHGNLNAIEAQRAAQAQDMFAQGAAAQGRAFDPAATVNYGSPQQIAQTQQAAMGNFGAQQQVSAPTLAAAQQAAMGNYGNAQSVQAQQAGYQTAANQAGFLQGTSARAQGINDLDFAQAQQARGQQQQSVDRLRGFVDQGPGPSVAQQQLRQAQEQNLGAALSLARSGRGNAAGNMKNAISENAATNAQTNQQAALLRAQEATDWRGQQLTAYGMENSAVQGMRQQDLGQAQAVGQHAVSREQLASNVDINRAQLEQGLSQFNAGAANQAQLTNAQLGTQANMTQAELANALNVARGNAGTNVSMQNAEQGNLMERTQGQMTLDAGRSTAELANARNVAMGQAGTNVSMTNAELDSARAREQAALANDLAIAQGNSNTDVGTTNATLGVRQNEANDALQQALYGYGVDSQRQEFDAASYDLGNDARYAELAADIQGRNLDRTARVNTENQNRRERERNATYSGVAAVLENL